MKLDTQLFIDILGIDSTLGRERGLADFIVNRLGDMGGALEITPCGALPSDPVNLFWHWGEPRIVYCTHLDTVPPYIPPTIENNTIKGRGTCDAKGQIFAMIETCRELLRRGESNFGLLLLYGEETGSFGAKEFRTHPGGDYVVVGEPTGNHMASASKGTKAFEVTITGKAFHSGYPQYGKSAVETFVDLVNKIREFTLPTDPQLGDTTFNIGRLASDNQQNILSPLLTCRVYFRTTFTTDAMIESMMLSLQSPDVSIKPLGGDSPMHYHTFDDMPSTTVSFGSDAPQLSNFRIKSLCGPGSILVAHTDDECIRLDEIEEAIELYTNIYYRYNNSTITIE